MHEDPSLSEDLCNENILESMTMLYGDFAVNLKTGEMNVLQAEKIRLSDGGVTKKISKESKQSKKRMEKQFTDLGIDYKNHVPLWPHHDKFNGTAKKQDY